MKIIHIFSALKMYLKLLFYKLLFRKNLSVKSIKTFVDGEIVIERGGMISFLGPVHGRKFAFFNVQGGELIIGHNVFFNRSCSLNCRESITIGNNCLFGENVKIYDHDHEFSAHGVSRSKFVHQRITIGNNTWIGSNVIILKGVNIGDNCVVAAGSIVTKNIQNNTVYYQKRNGSSINNI